MHRIQAAFGDATYLPTRLPLGYRYERWQRLDGHSRSSSGSGRARTGSTSRWSGCRRARPCDLGGAFHKTLQMDGNKVYYGGEAGEWIAWRCLTSPATKITYLLGTHSRGPLPDVALARVTASGKRFAR